VTDQTFDDRTDVGAHVLTWDRVRWRLYSSRFTVESVQVVQLRGHHRFSESGVKHSTRLQIRGSILFIGSTGRVWTAGPNLKPESLTDIVLW
jgi:hypothetical protein